MINWWMGAFCSHAMIWHNCWHFFPDFFYPRVLVLAFSFLISFYQFLLSSGLLISFILFVQLQVFQLLFMRI